ncbi:unnamed protein product [Dibothriocephalus latus]|uniref:Uncharacterized protein n=1 Tax=Dibothriocephalus latus TaxID=60516 RepID=A0A3P7NH25_DIBLA|nr:unnamed protein product [Dibothriocephalus latus]
MRLLIQRLFICKPHSTLRISPTTAISVPPAGLPRLQFQVPSSVFGLIIQKLFSGAFSNIQPWSLRRPVSRPMHQQCRCEQCSCEDVLLMTLPVIPVLRTRGFSGAPVRHRRELLCVCRPHPTLRLFPTTAHFCSFRWPSSSAIQGPFVGCRPHYPETVLRSLL